MSLTPSKKALTSASKMVAFINIGNTSFSTLPNTTVSFHLSPTPPHDHQRHQPNADALYTGATRHPQPHEPHTQGIPQASRTTGTQTTQATTPAPCCAYNKPFAVVPCPCITPPLLAPLVRPHRRAETRTGTSPTNHTHHNHAPSRQHFQHLGKFRPVVFLSPHRCACPGVPPVKRPGPPRIPHRIRTF